MINTPWLNNYGDVAHNLEYFSGSMYDFVKTCANKYPNFIAYDFFGKKTSYKQFLIKIEYTAKALARLGVKKGDRVTIALPNCEQAVVMFYAVNMVGAVCNMIHPLSSKNEIKFYLCESKSRFAITLDSFLNKFLDVLDDTPTKKVIVTSISDALPFLLKVAFNLKNTPQPVTGDRIISYSEFIRGGKAVGSDVYHKANDNDVAVILYSGGTTGATKGILLSNKNFNALSAQIIATNPMFKAGDKMLAVMPIFHGFGLGVSIHSMLTNGGRCILVPRFTPKSYAKLIVKHKCNFIAGVPTLFEALTRQNEIKGNCLKHLKGVFSGGDTLSVELKAKFDAFLKEHGATVQIREGYGTTECVTASCLTPVHLYKKGSIGQPFPDMMYKIVKPDTDTELGFNEEGEICISGPTVMLGYMDSPDENQKVLKTHADGLTWVHTGDLGTMDEDGFIYFKGRIKRIIVTSGYNVYPAQLENVIDSLEFVKMSCVIGVDDDLKMKKIKAFVMLNDNADASDSTKAKIFEHLKNNVAKYAMPYDIEFKTELPKTLVGKVAYRVLEEQELKNEEK